MVALGLKARLALLALIASQCVALVHPTQKTQSDNVSALIQASNATFPAVLPSSTTPSPSHPVSSMVIDNVRMASAISVPLTSDNSSEFSTAAAMLEHSSTSNCTCFDIVCSHDFFGGDIARHTNTGFKACMNLCNANERCVALSYTPSDSSCYLKDVIRSNVTTNSVWSAIKRQCASSSVCPSTPPVANCSASMPTGLQSSTSLKTLCRGTNYPASVVTTNNNAIFNIHRPSGTTLLRSSRKGLLTGSAYSTGLPKLSAFMPGWDRPHWDRPHYKANDSPALKTLLPRGADESATKTNMETSFLPGWDRFKWNKPHYRSTDAPPLETLLNMSVEREKSTTGTAPETSFFPGWNRQNWNSPHYKISEEPAQEKGLRSSMEDGRSFSEIAAETAKPMSTSQASPEMEELLNDCRPHGTCEDVESVAHTKLQPRGVAGGRMSPPGHGTPNHNFDQNQFEHWKRKFCLHGNLKNVPKEDQRCCNLEYYDFGWEFYCQRKVSAAIEGRKMKTVTLINGSIAPRQLMHARRTESASSTEFTHTAPATLPNPLTAESASCPEAICTTPFILTNPIRRDSTSSLESIPTSPVRLTNVLMTDSASSSEATRTTPFILTNPIRRVSTSSTDSTRNTPLPLMRSQRTNFVSPPKPTEASPVALTHPVQTELDSSPKFTTPSPVMLTRDDSASALVTPIAISSALPLSSRAGNWTVTYDDTDTWTIEWQTLGPRGNTESDTPSSTTNVVASKIVPPATLSWTGYPRVRAKPSLPAQPVRPRSVEQEMRPPVTKEATVERILQYLDPLSSQQKNQVFTHVDPFPKLRIQGIERRSPATTKESGKDSSTRGEPTLALPSDQSCFGGVCQYTMFKPAYSTTLATQMSKERESVPTEAPLPVTVTVTTKVTASSFFPTSAMKSMRTPHILDECPGSPACTPPEWHMMKPNLASMPLEIATLTRKLVTQSAGTETPFLVEEMESTNANLPVRTTPCNKDRRSCTF